MPDTISEFSLSKETLARQEERGLHLLEDLQNLVPSLRNRGQATEEAGRISDETINDLKRIDAFRAVVPEIYGGMEVPFPIIPQIFSLFRPGMYVDRMEYGFSHLSQLPVRALPQRTPRYHLWYARLYDGCRSSNTEWRGKEGGWRFHPERTMGLCHRYFSF